MRTILVIDDHVPTLTTLCLILNANGYRALQAENADQAERKFRSNPIDLVIVDHGLPGISGGELAGLLKQIRPVLVIMLSGNPDLKTTPAEVDLLLPKPQQIPALLAAMQGLFDVN
jgi:two-component system, OmpR family, phosphate regulon response regulator PhoB